MRERKYINEMKRITCQGRKMEDRDRREEKEEEEKERKREGD